MTEWAGNEFQNKYWSEVMLTAYKLGNLDISLHNFNSASEEKLIRKVFKQIVTVIPWWVESICISYVPNADACFCNVLTAYRQINIGIDAQFASSSFQLQVHTLIHELYHAVVGPYSEFLFSHVLPNISESNPALAKALHKHGMELTEALVTDLTVNAERLLNLKEST